MQSSLIGKIEKAKRYAQEKDRITLSDLTATFRGEHNTHTVGYRDGRWHCTCNFFPTWHTCSHVMALQRILMDMLPQEATANKELLQINP